MYYYTQKAGGEVGKLKKKEKKNPLYPKHLQEFRAHKNKSFQGSSLIKLNDPGAHFPSSWKTVKSSEVQRLLSACVMQSKRANRRFLH